MMPSSSGDPDIHPAVCRRRGKARQEQAVSSAGPTESLRADCKTGHRRGLRRGCHLPSSANRA